MVRARIQITGELIRKMFNFPIETEFVGASRSDFHDAIEFVVEHPDLEPQPEGAAPPLVLPTFCNQPPVVFLGWGQK